MYYVALDRNSGLGYNTLLMQLIPEDYYRASAHRHVHVVQFHTLPGLIDSWVSLVLLNSYPNACVPSRDERLYHFYDGLRIRYDPTGTHPMTCRIGGG